VGGGVVFFQKKEASRTYTLLINFSKYGEVQLRLAYFSKKMSKVQLRLAYFSKKMSKVQLRLALLSKNKWQGTTATRPTFKK